MAVNILIVGAGAIGCLVGGRLALSNVTVTLVGRDYFVRALQERGGLTIRQGEGQEQIEQIRAVDSVRAAFEGREQDFDAIILTIKSYDTAAALQEIADALETTGHKVPLVLSLQNGVGNEERIAATLDPAHVVAGVITTPVSVPEIAVIRIEKPQFNIGISPWHPAVAQTPFEALWMALQRAGFDVEVYPDPRGLKWTKLLMNMVGNASSAILNLPPADVFGDPQLVNLEIEAWREALAVMRADDIKPVNINSYPFATLAPLIRRLPKAVLRPILKAQVAGARGQKMPSLHIDLAKGKPQNEVQWLNGAVVQRGEQLGVATPVNRAFTDILTRMLQNPEQQTLWDGATVRLVATAGEYQDREKGA